MALISSFSIETFADFLKNNLNLDGVENVKCSVKPCHRNENILCLKVALGNNDLNLDHILVKMLVTKDVAGRKKNEYAKCLDNVFTAQDNNKNMYLGFAKKGILYPSRNNLENLKIILKNLAEFQADNLVRNKSEITTGDNLRNISDVALSLDFFKNVDKGYVSDIISRLQESIDELFRDGLLVKSVGSIFANNVFITAPEKCIFLNLGQEVLKSPVFDALIYIFALSDENFRQHHLKTLLTFYYRTFIEFLQKVDNSEAINFNINIFEIHVKVILSLVKFEAAKYLVQKERTTEENKNLEELLHNILFSLKNEQISYEDCLEAISNKLGSTDFELINYELILLDEQNGHLGTYFNLKITLNVSNKTEEFTMFTKILRTDKSLINNIIQSGISEKEQFFYRTLIPLLKDYGLETLVDFAPNCYFDRLNDVIICDNLVESSYKPFKTNAKLGYDVLKSAFIKAAKLHACSLILEDRMSENEKTPVRMGDIYKYFLKDWLFESREGLPKAPVCAAESKQGLDQLIDSFDDVANDISNEEFHRRVDAIYRMFLKRINTPAKQFRNVICHGDLYASNILTKYNRNGIAEDSFIVDFQGLRYAPITEDILMLTYFSAEKGIRDKYLDTLLEEYYQELEQIMIKFDLDLNTFYTPVEFKECVKYMKPVAIMAAVFYAQVISLTPEQKEKYFSDEKMFSYYLYENRREFIRSILSVPSSLSVFLKGLIQDLYDVCVSTDYDFL